MKYAFFDVDNTIYSGYTASELLFFLEENKYVESLFVREYRQIVNNYIARKIDYTQISQQTLDLVSKSLRDLTISTVDKLTEQLFDSKINPHNMRNEDPRLFNDSKSLLNKWVEPVLKYLRDKDYKLILISAGPDFMINKIKEMFGFDDAHSTTIPVKDNKYTGKDVILMNGDIKKEIINSYSNNSEFSIGFGDSIGDIPLLENVNIPFVVSNDHHSEMLDYAQSKGWTIFWNASQVIEILKSSK